jgi:hypothetical protein
MFCSGQKRKEVVVRDPAVSTDGEKDSSVSGMSDFIEKEVHDAPSAPAPPLQLSNLYLIHFFL